MGLLDVNLAILVTRLTNHQQDGWQKSWCIIFRRTSYEIFNKTAKHLYKHDMESYMRIWKCCVELALGSYFFQVTSWDAYLHTSVRVTLGDQAGGEDLLLDSNPTNLLLTREAVTMFGRFTYFPFVKNVTNIMSKSQSSPIIFFSLLFSDYRKSCKPRLLTLSTKMFLFAARQTKRSCFSEEVWIHFIILTFNSLSFKVVRWFRLYQLARGTS